MLRGALAVAILFGLILVAWFGVVLPVVGMATDRQSDIDALQERLASLHATIARIPKLERHDRTAKAKLDAEGGIWTGASEAAVATALQDRLRRAVTGNAGVVKSTAYLGAVTEKDLKTIRVRVSIDGTLATVQQTLAAVENGRPAMFVDSMTIAAPARFEADQPPMLGLDLEISAFMRKTDQ
jgi:hypothetical protein